MGKSNIYLHQLTWLRGFAAFIVVVSHTIRATEVAYASGDEATVFWLASVFDLGNFGVVLFFTLSGTTLYISSKGRLTSISEFYTKRFFRIWPAFFVSLLIYISFASVFERFYTDLQGHWIEFQFLADYSLADVLSYVTLTVNIFGTEGLFNNAYWSLPVEFQYYLIFPLLLVVLRNAGVVGPLLIGAAMFAISRFNLVNLNSSMVFEVGYSFCGGVVLGYFYITYSARVNALIATALLFASFAIVSMMTTETLPLPDFPLVSNIWNWYVFFSYIFVALCLFGQFKLPTKLSKALQVYGEISYSTYLYHNVVVALLVILLIQLQITNGLVRYLFVLIGTLVLTMPLALYSYRYIELPSISYSRRVVGALRSKR